MSFTTSVNNPTPIASLRQPRGFVSLNGIQVPWETFSVSNARYSSAGTFRATIPVTALPASLPLSNIINSSTLAVQINAGVPTQSNPQSASPSQLPLLIFGNADDVSFQPSKTVLTISGRDYTSFFLDNKIDQPNNPIGIQIGSILSVSVSSDIVSLIAKNRGLMPVVVPTTQPIGSYLQNQYNLISSQITEWDLMTQLARQENYDIFVIGKNLYFQPRGYNAVPYNITLTVPYYNTSNGIITSNAVDITVARNFKLAKDVVVNVTSWNVEQKISYKATATLAHTGSTSSNNAPVIYNYRIPNLTLDQTQQLAKSRLADISSHEMTLNVTMPGDSLLTAQSTIQFKDTNTLFDQVYYVKNVTRDMTFGGSYTMTIEAKTTPPSSVSLGT